jgi:group I intron endonuclease
VTILTGAQGATPAEPYGQVYLIENFMNGKRYVGQTTVGLDRRWKRHVQSSRSAGRTQPITSALRKYGPDAFTMTEVRRCRDQDELNRAEYEEVIRLNTFAPAGYNLRAGGGEYGHTSPELRARLSRDFTDERRQVTADTRNCPETAK